MFFGDIRLIGVGVRIFFVINYYGNTRCIEALNKVCGTSPFALTKLFKLILSRARFCIFTSKEICLLYSESQYLRRFDSTLE